jgi:hypothetical protein
MTYLFFNNSIITINETIKKNPTHNGDVTHHQDQSITPINFKVIKIKNINPKNPTPPDELLFAMIILHIVIVCKRKTNKKYK